MSEEAAIEFSNRLAELIKEYTVRMNNIELLGMLILRMDDISQKVRNDLQGPHQLS